MRSSLRKILPWSWALIWFMMVVSLKGTMLAIWVFALLVVVQALFQRPVIMKGQLRVIILPALLFLWYLVSWTFNDLPGKEYDEMVSKSALIMLPLLLLLSQNIKGVDLTRAMLGLISALVLTGIHLVIRAVIMIFGGSGMAEWTYHGFTAPYEAGAIYYSWYLTIAILFLLFGRQDPIMWKYRYIIIPFFLLLLLAASSKLFVIIMIPLAIYYFVRMLWSGKKRWLTLIVTGLIIMGGMLPFMNRIQELGNFAPEVVGQDQYAYDTPLNGITLRLVQWRLGLEIIKQENAWFFGVGPGNGQELLDKKYVSYGLYTGNEELGDTGYIGYNYHNQYIETLVETGIPGITILFMLLIGVTFVYKKILTFPKAVFLVTILFFLTESVLERQAGIIAFSMLIAFAPAGENHKLPYNVRFNK